MEEYLVSIFTFDAIYVDGEDLTLGPYLVRRRTLEEIIQESDKVKVARCITSNSMEKLEKDFHEAIQS